MWSVFALSWDPTITAGTVIEGVVLLITVLAAYNGLTNRLVRFEATIDSHTARLDETTDRIDTHERKLNDVSERMQRMIGRLETREARYRNAD